MRFLPLAPLAALALNAFAGGYACELAYTSRHTPELESMVFGATKARTPENARLKSDQIRRLCEANRAYQDERTRLDGLAATLPLAKGGITLPADLPGSVTALLARALRDTALLIDPETSDDFHLARQAAIAAMERGDTAAGCPLCVAVRRGVEAAWAWDPADFERELTAAEKTVADEVAAGRQAARAQWLAALKKELTADQLAWLVERQERWLMAEVGRIVETGLRGADACAACDEAGFGKKCEFCVVVLAAVKKARE